MAENVLNVKVEFDKSMAKEVLQDFIREEYGMTLEDLADLVQANASGRILEITEDVAAALHAGAYVLRDDDLAGAGHTWIYGGKRLYTSYYKASEMLDNAARTAMASIMGKVVGEND